MSPSPATPAPFADDFDDEDDQDDDGPRDLTAEERRAIATLQRLGERWPRTLTLASMGGELVVVSTDDDVFREGPGTSDRQERVLADIKGIPNTGGDW